MNRQAATGGVEPAKRDPTGKDMICDVWAENFFEEMTKIRALLETYKCITLVSAT